jgi:hypothetical protein
LLRIWREKKAGLYNWRASLESSETGEKKGFSSLEDLMAYLIGKTTSKEHCKGER